MVIKPLNILGLMGGTSLDGIKAELVTTDGVDIYQAKAFRHIPYPEHLREKIHSIIGKKIFNPEDKQEIESIDAEFDSFVLEIINEYLSELDCPLDFIALEGPTICHEPENTYSYQLGKGRLIAQETGIKVITHFHNADILNGGLGSPISASYYHALAQNLEKPVVFLNLGGITTLTYIGQLGEISAFDTGPGTALIDDWMIKHGGMAIDYNGKYAATGKADEKILAFLLKHAYFSKQPPKFVDRNAFNNKTEHLEGLSVQDGAATATAFVSESIAHALENFVPELPVRAVLCGGGQFNPTLVRMIRQKLKDKNIMTETASELGLEINEAQATAFLAARRFYGLPITFPTTTGVPQPLTGGEIYEKEN